MWHLTDFVFGAPDAEAIRLRGKLGAADLKSFQERVRDSCPALKLCWELANGAKHFHKKPRAQVDEVTVSCAPAYIVFLPIRWQPERIKRRAKIVFPDGRRLRASEVFRDVIAEWEVLLA